MTKRICLVCPNAHPPWIEGIRNNVFNLAKNLKKRGQEVTIISNWDKEESWVSEGVKIICFPRYIFNSQRIISLMTESSFDVINFHSLENLFLPLIARLKHKNMILTVYSSGEIKSILRKTFLKFFHHKFRRIIVTSNDLCRKINLRKDTIVIPVGFDKTKFKNLETSRDIDLLFTAGPSKMEGAYLLTKILKDHPEIKSVFALYNLDERNNRGREKLIQHIKTKKINNISVVGNLDKLEELMNKSKLFIMPIQEGHIKMSIPISLLEAMNSGCVCVCTNINAHAEVIKDKVNGVLFNPKDRNSCEKAIIYALSQQHHKLVLEAQSTMKRWPNFESIASHYDLEVYKI